MNIQELKNVARNLIKADDGENVEYARGICEFLADIDGVEDVDHAEMAIEIGREIGVAEEYIKSFY